MLFVTEEGDIALLTNAELADAIGVASDWAGLSTLNARVGELMASACGLQRAGVFPLTLREETLTETIRLRCKQEILYLSRKPVIEILSLTEDGTLLHEEYDFERRDGRSLVRLVDDELSSWEEGKIEISYRAGWDEVPNDLKLLAAKLAVALYGERHRDPSLKRESIPGVIDREYWVGAKDDPLITAEIVEGLRAGGYLMHEMVY